MSNLAQGGDAHSPLRTRRVAHLIALAEQAELHVRGPDQDLWMSRFKQEHENLVVALTWCCDGSLDPQSGLRLAAATGDYWGWNSVELGYRLTLAVLEHDRAAAVTPAREGTLRALARMSEFRGRYEEVSVDLLEATVGLASRRGEHEIAARFWGAADQQLQAWGYRHEPGEVEHIEPLLASSRRALGDEAFDAAEAAGRAMAFEQALIELQTWLGSER